MVLTPETGTSAEEAFRALIRALAVVHRVMQPYFAQFGINASQWDVLWSLHRAEEDGLPGLGLIELSQRLLIRPPSVRGVVVRLERAGLVARGDRTADLRVKPVALTWDGRQLVEQVLKSHGAQIEAVMGGLGPTELDDLGRLLGRLERHLKGTRQVFGGRKK